MVSRAVRAFKLDRSVFREVGDDPAAVLPALGLVVLVGLAIGTGMMTAPIDVGGDDAAEVSLSPVVGLWMAVMGTLVGWVLWGVVVYLMGKLFMHGGASLRQILRVLGIGFAPGVLLVLLGVPILGPAAYLVGAVAVLVSGVVGVHEVQDTDWVGAGLSAGIGWLIPFFAMPWLVLAPSLA